MQPFPAPLKRQGLDGKWRDFDRRSKALFPPRVSPGARSSPRNVACPLADAPRRRGRKDTLPPKRRTFAQHGTAAKAAARVEGVHEIPFDAGRVQARTPRGTRSGWDGKWRDFDRRPKDLFPRALVRARARWRVRSRTPLVEGRARIPSPQAADFRPTRHRRKSRRPGRRRPRNPFRRGARASTHATGGTRSGWDGKWRDFDRRSKDPQGYLPPERR